MHRSAAAFVLVALVVVGVAGVSYLWPAGAKGSEPLSSPCSDSIRVGTSYNQSVDTLTTTTFVMAPGSTAKVCVTYISDGSAVTPSAGPLACGPSENADGRIVEKCSGQLTVVASGPVLTHPRGPNITIAYELRASEDAEGVFWFWVDCGEVFPLAVGAPPSSLMFPIIAGCVYEPNAPTRGSVTGFSGMGVAMVRVG